MVEKFDHSYSNSPAVFKEFNNFQELSNHFANAIEVERCGIRPQTAGDLCNRTGSTINLAYTRPEKFTSHRFISADKLAGIQTFFNAYTVIYFVFLKVK